MGGGHGGAAPDLRYLTKKYHGDANIEYWNSFRENIGLNFKFTKGNIARGIFWLGVVPYAVYSSVAAQQRRQEQYKVDRARLHMKEDA